MLVKCHKCHQENPADSKLCKKCGAELIPSAGIPIHTQTLQPPPRETLEDVDIEEIINGKYKIVDRLGSGGMGVVYKAEQKEPVRRTVALKIIKLGMDTREVVARFDNEKQALAVMGHPNIAKVLDAGATKSGRPYFVMEYVPGVPITHFCDKHRLTIKQRLELFIPVCSAVQHAHQKGVIHRDLKPSNVLLEVQDGKAIPKIIDFGIAKATDQRLAERTLFTEQGRFIGTPEYMSPEQAETSGLDVDTRTDIYSLGVMLYELLTGVLPFDPGTLRSAAFAEIQRIIREVDPPRASTRLNQQTETRQSIADQRKMDFASLHKQLKGDLDWILIKAMEKDRTRRYTTASDLAADIVRHLKAQPISARPPSNIYSFGKFMRRHRFGVSMAILLILSIFIGGAVATVGLVRATQAERLAKKEAQTAEQISDFLFNLFRVSDPSEARGNSITAREILDKGTGNIEKELKSQPEIQAELMSVMGAVYQNLGLYEQATSLFEKALAIRRQLYGKDHLEVVASMNNLANLLADKADYEGAELLLREALEMHRRLRADKKILATILNDLAATLHDQGDFTDAELMLREALEIKRTLLGDEHPDVAKGLNNLAALLEEKGDYPGAAALFRESLAMNRKLLGDDAPAVASAMNNLGVLMTNQGEYEEAERLLKEALSIRRKVYGDEHPIVTKNLSNLGIVQYHKGDYESAKNAFLESVMVNRKLLGDEHPDVADGLNNLAYMLRAKGEYGEAEIQFRESLSIYRKVFGKEHPRVAASLTNLAVLLQLRKEYEKAEPLLREALAMRRRLLGDEHPDVATSLYHLGNLLFEKGDYEEAEFLLLDSLKIRQQALPGGHLRTIESRRELGQCLAKLKRYDEAEKLLLENFRLLELKKDDTEIIKALNHIIELYRAWGKPEKISEYEAILKKIENEK